MQDRNGFWCWKHHPGEYGDYSVAGEFTRLLAEQGIRFSDLRESDEDRIGVFLFRDPTPDLEKAIARISNGGARRIVAVYLGEGLLSGPFALRLLSSGAGDVLNWNGVLEPARILVSRLLRWQTVETAVRAVSERGGMIGTARAWISVLRQVVEASMFSNSPGLITGETGTGKEMMSRLIHSLDRRSEKGPFVTLDCTTVVPELSGSEFFGHERGAFTNAFQAREGAFALANGGTLFLDEVGELPAGLQSEILRAIQEKTYKKVGSHTWQKTDFRLVCATNLDLHGEVEGGSFRKDLYHRIAGWVVHLPSLDQRREDILPLTRHFLREALGPDWKCELDDSVKEYLLARKYPGNVRELKHLIQAMAMRNSGSGPVSIGNLPEHLFLSAGDSGAFAFSREAGFESAVRLALVRGMTLREIAREAEETAIRLAIESEGSLQMAADRLGVCRRTLELRRAFRRSQDGAGDCRQLVKAGSLN